MFYEGLGSHGFACGSVCPSVRGCASSLSLSPLSPLSLVCGTVLEANLFHEGLGSDSSKPSCFTGCPIVLETIVFYEGLGSDSSKP